MLHVYVDADACPVKNEIYKVAGRYGLTVTLVANSWMRTPERAEISLVMVDDGFDAADDWIAEHAGADDVVITSDVPLAGRCVGKGAAVMTPTGRVFDENNIGDVMATRDLLTELRGAGEVTSGPPPMRQRDRSHFLQQLDIVIQSIRRRHPGA